MISLLVRLSTKREMRCLHRGGWNGLIADSLRDQRICTKWVMMMMMMMSAMPAPHCAIQLKTGKGRDTSVE